MTPPKTNNTPPMIGQILKDLSAHIRLPTPGAMNQEIPETLKQILNLWPNIVGTTVTACTQPFSFRQGILNVRVQEMRWLPELRSLEPRYVKSINKHLKQQRVHRVLFQLGDISQPITDPTWPPQTMRREDPAPPPWLQQKLSPAEQQYIDAQLEDLPEGEIKELTRRLMQKHHQFLAYQRNNKS
ncbi:MAG: DciA family protein [Myxococcota bacterium]